MRLLITRPAANAAPLAEKLAAQGHDIIISPVIDIYPTETPLPENANDFAALALTSANGVHALAAKLPATGSGDEVTVKAWQALPAFAVGPQTAATLKAYGWSHIVEAQGDVDSLATHISDRLPDRSMGADKPVLHVAGRDRAGNLQAALAAAHIDCALLMLYEAEPALALSPAAQAALADQEEPVDGVLLYSQRSAKLFIALSRDVLSRDIAMVHRPVAYCLSPAIAKLMQEAGFATKTAAVPQEAAMLALTAAAAR